MDIISINLKGLDGFTNVPHFFEKRSLLILSKVFDILYKNKSPIKRYLFYTFEQAVLGMSKIARYVPTHYSQVNQYLSGTLYVGALRVETTLDYIIVNKIKRLEKILSSIKFKKEANSIISTQSITNSSNIPDNAIDYVFTDPPFGGNLMYSELNLLWESWLKIFTNNEDEAIINNVQQKGENEYSNLMKNSFKEYFRVLKPNRWITVEFHNSRAEIWKIIQDAISKAGFIIAQVAVLDKQQGTFKQVISPGAVKNDLVINAYKPSESFRKTFLKKAGFNMEIDFITMHLKRLPIEPNIERTQQMLYSKLLAQYIQNGFEVRMDATEFYEMLSNNFEERDGYWLIYEQIPYYEQKLKLKEKLQDIDLGQEILGISDEKTAIIWLASFLKTPRTYDEIFIDFSKNLMTSQDKIPGLKDILKENFGTEGGKFRLSSNLEREKNEEIRNKHLIQEFNEILREVQFGKKIKEVRKEALLLGLMKLYKEKDKDNIKVLAKCLDHKIITSSDDISAIIDWAKYG